MKADNPLPHTSLVQCWGLLESGDIAPKICPRTSPTSPGSDLPLLVHLLLEEPGCSLEYSMQPEVSRKQGVLLPNEGQADGATVRQGQPG